eukprot:SAG31_NODE_695_length_12765_cov_6.974499_14_plen_148_part_00
MIPIPRTNYRLIYLMFQIQDDELQRRAHPAEPYPPDTDMRQGTASLWYHYYFMFEKMFAEYDYVAFFEDDILVSLDVDRYLCRMRSILQHDSTVFEITTHNDAGFYPTASDETALIRHGKMCVCGTLCPLNLSFNCSAQSTLRNLDG